MGNSAIIEKMIKHRALASDEDYEVFENSLNQLADNISVDDFPQILNVFYDETDDHEFMWEVVHLIERIPDEDYLRCIALYTPHMADAHEWSLLLNSRIMNTWKYYDRPDERYLKIICEMDKESQHRYLNLLFELKKEDPGFFDSRIDIIAKAVEQCDK